ncbi:nitronate monooxygenase [Agromyces flavus]|uniref:Propionate 3-nitronate monooxygenase n=1 Tax=Agromyces flavus TaxID=589382 RepID=A0A1H1ZZI4_9MICO|nr:nitronate monooxygenase [Agromyces flavus]MCP2367341.1 nitronate monooxygenase [Agromyces flavus]GGI45918.1 oxidoreductase [Agromyces flavus]SDT38822.1 nitronate monooxygenase [Agromyces flavus]
MTDATTRLTELLGIRHPIVLGPFGGLSSVELTATVSELGGLGSYGLYGYDAERILATGAAIRAATSAPFNVNLWLPLATDAAPAPDAFGRAVAAVRPIFDELGVRVPEAPPERFLPPFEEQWDAVLELRPAVASFVFGVPPAEVVEGARERGISLIGTATTVDEAVALADGGVDAIVATGLEAGGHRVAFRRRAEQVLVGSISLIPQVVDAVDLPVIAAGGIADRRGVAAAIALGAGGVQVGTAFLRTRQSATTDGHRRAIEQAAAEDTVLTRAMSGRLARGAANRAVREIEEAGAIAPFPMQNWLTGRFRAEAEKAGRSDLQSLWMGQSARLATHDDARDVFAELLAGVPAAAGSVGAA